MPIEVRLEVRRAERTDVHQIGHDDLSEGVVVGRQRDADVTIHHPGVSRTHCRLALDGDTVTLEDLGSASGTHVDDTRLDAHAPRPIDDGIAFAVGPIAVRAYIADVHEDATIVHTAASLDDEDDEDDLDGSYGAAAFRTVVAGEQDDDDDDGFVDAGTHVDLTGDELIIGRGDQCDVVLDNLLLSRRHARLRHKGRAWYVDDLNSTNGTFVNGQQLKRAYALEVGDVLRIGPYELVFQGDHLESSVLDEEGIAVMADGLSKPVKDRETGEPIKLLDEVAFRIEPGEFVGLLGPSGCGKSTLMDALNGRRPAPDGRVFYNDDDLYRNFEAYKVGIGYVPQELIFHENLPLADALRYASRIRLSKDVTDDEIERNIDEVLKTVGLAERRGTTIADLSGGQKKRVSLAIELLSKPNVLFLDEVTSGLDLGTEKEMMQLFRRLADSGITVICITHFVDSLEMCDRLVCLMRGRLVFYGRPEKMREHFAIDRIAGIYDVLKNDDHTDKSQAVRMSERKAESHRDEFIRKYGDPADAVNRTDVHAERRMETLGKGGTGQQAIDLDALIQQTTVLTRRYVQLLTRDRMTTGILVGLAPLIAVMLCILVSSFDIEPEAYTALDARISAGAADAAVKEAGDAIRDTVHKQRIVGFGAILTVLFLALFGSVQEVVKELRVYAHERFARLQIGPYMLSKLGPLAVLGAIQSALVVLVINLAGVADAGSVASQFGILFATAFAGTCLGLAISAAVPEKSGGGTTDAATLAVMMMNAVVIPQVLFAGALVALGGISEWIARLAISGYWSFEAFLSLVYDHVGETVIDAIDTSGSAADVAPELFALAEELRGDERSYLLAIAVVLGHAAIFIALFGIALAKKDGPDGFRNMLKKLPADSKSLLGQAQAAVKKKNAERS